MLWDESAGDAVCTAVQLHLKWKTVHARNTVCEALLYVSFPCSTNCRFLPSLASCFSPFPVPKGQRREVSPGAAAMSCGVFERSVRRSFPGLRSRKLSFPQAAMLCNVPCSSGVPGCPATREQQLAKVS